MNEKFKMTNLKKIREKKGITQIKLSTEIEVSQELISHYEQGISKPNIDNLMKLADYFNCSTDYLLNRTSIPTVFRIGSDEISDNEFMNKYNLLPNSLKRELSNYLDYLCDKNNK